MNTIVLKYDSHNPVAMKTLDYFFILKVADLVIQKLRNNEMPPTVTVEELVELDVL